MREQRRFMRVELSLPVECFAIDGKGVAGPAVRAGLSDLSGGGARLSLDGPIALGAAMRIALRCDEPAVDLALLCTVVRCTRRDAGGFDVGVQFVALPPAERVALTRFVLARARATGQRSETVMNGGG
jgi:c-di-GMP-binding flagellar brake protein YcgR